eukprot:s1778_g12.t1
MSLFTLPSLLKSRTFAVINPRKPRRSSHSLSRLSDEEPNKGWSLLRKASKPDRRASETAERQPPLEEDRQPLLRVP